MEGSSIHRRLERFCGRVGGGGRYLGGGGGGMGKSELLVPPPPPFELRALGDLR